MEGSAEEREGAHTRSTDVDEAPARPAKITRRDWTLPLLVALVAVSFLLRMAWLSKPDGALIFDESYYVNAAQPSRSHDPRSTVEDPASTP